MANDRQPGIRRLPSELQMAGIADSIRAKLAEAGIELRDVPAGTEWSVPGWSLP